MALLAPLASDIPRTRGRILVVDDSPIVRRIVGAGLREGGFATVEAKDGAEALALLRGEAFDVVVTDMQMPGVDGLGVLEGVRSEGLGAEVVVLTGARAEDIEAAVGALRLGAHDYIVKGPASGPAVKLSVQRALDKKRLRDENVRLVDELRTLSLRDSLTGLPNRRAFDLAMTREFDRARRHGHSLSLLIADLDHFKAVNDTYGHAAGDGVLRHFAHVASGRVPERRHRPSLRRRRVRRHPAGGHRKRSPRRGGSSGQAGGRLSRRRGQSRRDRDLQRGGVHLLQRRPPYGGGPRGRRGRRPLRGEAVRSQPGGVVVGFPGPPICPARSAGIPSPKQEVALV